MEALFELSSYAGEIQTSSGYDFQQSFRIGVEYLVYHSSN